LGGGYREKVGGEIGQNGWGISQKGWEVKNRAKNLESHEKYWGGK